jgi:hypothetical protein
MIPSPGTAQAGPCDNTGRERWLIEAVEMLKTRLLGWARGCTLKPSAKNGGETMKSRRFVLETLAVATLSGIVSPALADSRRAVAVRMFDTDNDGTIDLAEAKKAAISPVREAGPRS